MASGNFSVRHPALRVAHTAFIAAASLNFLVFALMAAHLGGDALSGRVVAHQYFLGYKGGYTGVSKQVFEYSKVHEISVMVTLPLAIVTGFFFGLPKRRGGT
jgi:hypothetical protein